MWVENEVGVLADVAEREADVAGLRNPGWGSWMRMP